MDKLLTIFTPTYNRANTLVRLYNSLLAQTIDDFIWLIVDDGSTDNTKEIVGEWIKDGLIKIQYYKQSNQGKSMAHNKGVELTNTELFVCVDSDDYLEKNTIEEIKNTKYNVRENIVGILSPRLIKNKNKNFVICKSTENTFTTLKNAYDNLGLKVDTMLVIKTRYLKKYKFPYFENEKFVPEAYLYDLIDQEGEYIVLNKHLYLCEYLDEGYTKNMAKTIKNNPNGYIAYIRQRINFETNLKCKFLDYIRYIAIAKCTKYEKIHMDKKDTILKLLAYPFGVLLYFKKYSKI